MRMQVEQINPVKHRIEDLERKEVQSMDLGFLFDYINPLILGICLLVGYVLKTAFDWFPNKYIPLAALSLGTVIAVLIHLQSGICAEVVLGGMISGLASTGLYEMLRNMLNKGEKKEANGEEQ